MAIKSMTPEEFLEFLKEQQGSKTQAQFADSLGVSPQYLSDVYNGRREPGEKIAFPFGATKESSYRVDTVLSERLIKSRNKREEKE